MVATRDTSMIKVVLGGIAGLVLGQFVLWWLPAPYRADPFRLAPKLPEPLAFMAPDSLRGVLTFPEMPDATAPKEPATPDAAASRQVESEKEVTAEADPSAQSSKEEMVLGLADAPRLAMPELQTSLDEAARRDTVLLTRSNWTSDEVSEWYQGLCRLAYCITFADMNESDIDTFADATREFVAQVARDPRRVEEISKASETMRVDSENHRRGIIVTGRVQSVSIVGQLFQTGLQSDDADDSIDIVSRRDPRAANAYQLGDQVLVMGVLIHHPSLQLLGYQGDSDMVILGGLPTKIPVAP